MKEHFFSGEHITFNAYPIRIYLETRFTQNQYLSHEVNSKKLEFYSEDQNWSYANQKEENSYDIRMYIKYDDSITNDGYHLVITDEITLYVSNYRGIIYGISHLEEMIDDLSLPKCDILECSDIEYRGVIEGFYGIPWNHKNRLDLFDVLQQHKMNTYIYAPKDDSYHREKWRESYPQSEEDKLVELIDKANKYHMHFVYCISPGNSIDMCSEKDIERVATKLLELKQYGVNSFALLMDDINYNLSDQEKAKYDTPGKAHGVLANKVYDIIKNELSINKFYICPTEYWQNWDTPYRKDLKETLDKDIEVFFTGYHTIAKSIPKNDIEIAYNSFGHKLAIWDNYPTNDVNKDRLYLGPITNRTKQLDNKVSTYVSNPMNQFHLSEIALSTIGEYLWNPQGYNEDIALLNAKKLFSSKWSLTEGSVDLLVKLNQSTRLKVYEFKDLKYGIDIYDKVSIKEYLDRFNALLDELTSIKDKELYKEYQPWLETLKLETKYLEYFYNKKGIKTNKHSMNLGYNFGTYAQSKLEVLK